MTQDTELQERLQRIEDVLMVIHRDMQDIKSRLHKMEGHVDFVEDVYDRVKKPFYKVMSLVSRRAIEPPSSTPAIDDT